MHLEGEMATRGASKIQWFHDYDYDFMIMFMSLFIKNERSYRQVPDYVHKGFWNDSYQKVPDYFNDFCQT